MHKNQSTAHYSESLFLITVLLFFIGFNAWAEGQNSVLELAEPKFLDGLLMFSYSPALDSVSDYLQYAAFFSPALLCLAADSSDLAGLTLAYAGAGALSLGARFGLKALISRPRPYMYYPNPPQKEIARGKQYESFPSGHSIMAFCGASFTATAYSLKYKDSPYALPGTVLALSLAGACSTLRIASGSHFLSDVLAGAILGSLIGTASAFALDAIDKN